MKAIHQGARALIGAITIFAVIGCGGSGGGTSASVAPPSSRQVVAQAIQEVFGGTQQVSASKPAAGPAQKAATSFPPDSRLALAKSSPSSPGRSDDTGLFIGKVERQGDLWTRIDILEFQELAGYTNVADLKYSFFLDEALTQPAGFQRTINKTENGINRYLLETEITAGPQAGAYLKDEKIYDTNTGGFSAESEGTTLVLTTGPEPREVLCRYKMKFNYLPGTDTQFEYETTTEGKTLRSTGTFFSDGRIQTKWTTASGYEADWTQNPDGTGFFTVVKADDPLTPASGEYNAEGIGTVTFADGTTEAFNLNDNKFYIGN